MSLPAGLWWRLLLSTTAMLGLVALGGETLVRAALPAVRWAIGLLAAELQVTSLALENTGAGRLVLLQVNLDRTLVLGGHAIVPEPGSTAQASTLALQCLHGPALALALGLSWPGLTVARLVCAVLLSTGLLLADLPVVLAGSVWQVLVDSVAPGDHTPLLALKAFISQGGRLALGLTAGVAAVWLCARHRSTAPRF